MEISQMLAALMKTSLGIQDQSLRGLAQFGSFVTAQRKTWISRRMGYLPSKAASKSSGSGASKSSAVRIFPFRGHAKIRRIHYHKPYGYIESIRYFQRL